MGAAPLALGPDRDGRVMTAEGDRITFFGGRPASPAGVWRACPESSMGAGHINAHTHVYSGLAPLGMPPPEPPPESFLEILERIWWRLDRALDAASLRAAARYYVAESLLAGTTTLVDHHESPAFIDGSLDVLADACQELGMRALLTYGATERNGGRDEARRGLAECRRFIDSNDRPLVRGVVGLHASFTVSDDTVVEAAELCRELGTVLHVHLAEDAADVDDARRRGYDGPLERLLQLGALPPGSILAHGVHCSSEQVLLAAEHGLWIVQNPRSNRGNGVGYPPALAASDRVALGTDGYPASMADEAAALESEARAHGEDPVHLPRRLLGGYRLAAERFGARFSPLWQGAVADVVATAQEEGNGCSARHVVVAGRPVVEDGGLLTGDLEKIRADARAQASRLWQRMARL
jgi:cytosine/adenosine deaminase-related metal-dependent hydrolase